MKFAMQGAQDNGEFFTPPSLVQTIVNVIEPDHGIGNPIAVSSGQQKVIDVFIPVGVASRLDIGNSTAGNSVRSSICGLAARPFHS